MNAIDLLKEDHDTVDELFKRIEDTPPSKHPAIFKRIKNELDVHARIEEKLFYPKLKAEGNKELVDITMEGLQEHAQMKKFLQEIGRSTSKDTREAKLKVLIEDTRHHVKEEENEMFPMVEDQFSSDELDELGKKMEAEKIRLQKSKGITARRAKQSKGTVSAILDKAKELVTAVFDGNSSPKARSKSGGTKASNTARTPRTSSKKTSPKRSAGKSTTSR